jgi:3-oxoacyl-[acyl-carrier protein] reductase
MKEPFKRLTGKTAIVTGGGSGIGRAICRRLAADGALVAVVDLDADAADRAASGLGKLGWAAALDVSSAEQVAAFAKQVSDRHGQLDILVNNAGIVRDAALHKMRDEDWARVHDVISTGAFLMCRAFAPLLRTIPEDGHHRKVINVASVSGVYGRELSANYCSAKAGLIGLTKALAREWAPRQVNVNAIAPGFVGGTKLTTPVDDGRTAMREDFLTRVVAQIPLGRGGTPEDISGVAAFLASRDSDYITGQVIEAHGGLEILRI